MSHFGSNGSSPGYIEAVASTKRKTKEDIRIEQLIPSEILDNAGGIKKLLESYYQFNNMKEFIYTEVETLSDVILSGNAVFRIHDPEDSNDHFFNDSTGANTSAVMTLTNGTAQPIGLGASNILISNGNELPGSLLKSTASYGKTFTITGLEEFNGLTVKLVTPTTYWVGPGPSYVLNAIEEALNIDENTEDYLELMQREIAAAIPRDLTVDKRTLYKSIVDFYKVRGSTDSIDIFFRLLFNEPVEVQEPWNKTLIPSSGQWVPGAVTTGIVSGNVSSSTAVTLATADVAIRLGAKVTGAGITAQDVTVAGIDGTSITLSSAQTIATATSLTFTQTGTYADTKGQLSNNIKITDSVFWQKFSYLIRTGKNLSDWKNAFAKLVHPAGFKFFGEILILTQLTRAVLGDTDKVDKRIAGTGPTQASAALSQFSNGGFGVGNTTYAYKDVYGRSNRKTLSSVPTLQPGVIGIEDLPLLVQAFVSMFTPNIEARVNRSATTTMSLNSGAVATITPADRGYGYPLTPAAAPTVTIQGDGSGATATCTLDELGQVDTITVTAAGSGYTTVSAHVSANGDQGKVNEIVLSNLGDKKYRTAPTIIFEAPTSTDVEGVLLASNVTATAVCVLDAEGEIASVSVTNVGNGYVVDPILKIGSTASGETRAPDLHPILILVLNHLEDLSRTIAGNNHFNRKSDYDTSTKFRDETPIEHYLSNTIQNGLPTSINRYSSLSNIELQT